VQQPTDATGVKRAAKVPSLQMAEQARKKEEQLLLERKLKKEELERQREAARRAAVQPVPAQKEGDVGAKAAACLAPSSTSGLAAAARAPEGAAKATALPRLKQAMEVRPFLQPSRPLVRRTRYCATGSRTVERVAPPKPGAGKQGAYLALAPRVWRRLTLLRFFSQFDRRSPPPRLSLLSRLWHPRFVSKASLRRLPLSRICLPRMTRD
jgi:hypothetical protein